MNEQQMIQMFTALVKAFDRVAPEMAKAQREYYESLVEAGFTEEQAFELVKEADVNASD